MAADGDDVAPEALEGDPTAPKPTVLKLRMLPQSPGAGRKYQHLRMLSLEGMDERTAAALLKQYGRLVEHLARRTRSRFSRPGYSPIDYEDFVSIGRAVLLQSWVDYDATRGATFVTWAALNIGRAFYELTREFISANRRAQFRPIILSGDASASRGGGRVDSADVKLFDCLSNAKDAIDDTAMDKDRKVCWLETVLETPGILDSRERVVLQRQREGVTLQAIGDELGITRQRVEQISRSAIARVRKWAAISGLVDDDADE